MDKLWYSVVRFDERNASILDERECGAMTEKLYTFGKWKDGANQLMLHLSEMMTSHDALIDRLMAAQETDPQNPDFGGFILPKVMMVEPRESGFRLSDLIIGYICKESCHYHDERTAEAIRRTLVYMERHQRPDGCFDLSGCNFASPPDTAFMTNAIFNAWWLMEKRCDATTEWLKAPVKRFIETCAEGIAAGGFHTPNHRWAISACLKCAWKATGRKEFSDRADQYLAEGLDINEDGEFAERSAGNYNQVNDDQMIRLYIGTGEKRFLEASKANLEMMFAYIDPDDSVFTNNSTRQDNGRKVYLDTYYILFLLTGYFLKDKKLASAAEVMYATAKRHGIVSNGIEWLLLYDDLDGYGDDETFDTVCMTKYSRMFPASRIARTRNGNYSWTIMEDRPNFLYFQSGALTMYLVIYANICDRRHFLGEKMEAIPGGYQMKSHAAGWYYKPFWPNLPATSDWWAMDNPHTREKVLGLPLDMTVNVADTGDGIDVAIHTEGIDRLPFRIEAGVLPCMVRGEQFLMEGKAGESIILMNGEVELSNQAGDVITLSPGFCEHGNLGRSTNAYPQSPDHFTLYMTDFTPVDRVIHLGTKPFDPRSLRGSSNR